MDGFLFTGRWAYNWSERGGAYKRKFTVLRKNNIKKSHDQKLADDVEI